MGVVLIDYLECVVGVVVEDDVDIFEVDCGYVVFFLLKNLKMWLRMIVRMMMYMLELKFMGMFIWLSVCCISVFRFFVLIMEVMIIMESDSMMVCVMLVMICGRVNGSLIFMRICIGFVLKVCVVLISEGGVEMMFS